MRLTDGDLEALDGERVFRADVDEALGGADRVAGDRHGLEDGVGIAFQRGAVHVRAGVALVGVADHVLLALGLLLRELPLHSGREARAAAAAQARLQDLLHHLLRRHLEEHLLDGLVAVARDVVLDLLRVDDAAVAQHDAVLLLVERDVRLRDELLRLLGVVAQTLHQHVERALREDLHDRALLAEPEAARHDHLHLVLEAGRLKFLLERLDDGRAAARTARGAAAHKNV